MPGTQLGHLLHHRRLTLSLRIVALGIHSLNNILNINNILNLNSIFTLNLRTVLRNWRSWSQKIKFIRELTSGSRSRSRSRLSNLTTILCNWRSWSEEVYRI